MNGAPCTTRAWVGLTQRAATNQLNWKLKMVKSAWSTTPTSCHPLPISMQIQTLRGHQSATGGSVTKTTLHRKTSMGNRNGAQSSPLILPPQLAWLMTSPLASVAFKTQSTSLTATLTAKLRALNWLSLLPWTQQASPWLSSMGSWECLAGGVKWGDWYKPTAHSLLSSYSLPFSSSVAPFSWPPMQRLAGARFNPLQALTVCGRCMMISWCLLAFGLLNSSGCSSSSSLVSAALSEAKKTRMTGKSS